MTQRGALACINCVGPMEEGREVSSRKTSPQNQDALHAKDLVLGCLAPCF